VRQNAPDRDWDYFKIYSRFVGACESFLLRIWTEKASAFVSRFGRLGIDYAGPKGLAIRGVVARSSGVRGQRRFSIVILVNIGQFCR